MDMTLVFQRDGAFVQCTGEYSSICNQRLFLFVRLAQPTRVSAISSERVAGRCAYLWH